MAKTPNHNSRIVPDWTCKSAEYCAYLRKSRADRDAELRGEGETLERHRRILTEFAENNNIHISKFYCEVVSGDTIEDRPSMQELLTDVECGKWAGVLVVEVERLARGNTKDQGAVADAFKYSNTKIITPIKTYDPRDEYDEEYFEFGLFMSRREYKTINRRLQRGRAASVREGNYIASTAPYGYKRLKNPGGKGFTLEIIPEQAKIIHQIFQWYCYGETLPDGTTCRMGTDAIASKLDALHIKPPKNDLWSKATLSDMLKNKIYAGYVCFGKQREIKSTQDGKVIKTRRTNTEYICAKGNHQAIVDEALFDLAQHTRNKNRKNTLPVCQKLQNPLAGIVFCRKCRRMMTRLAPNSRNKYAVLKCPNKYCSNVSSPIFLIEEQILLFIEAWTAAYEFKYADAAPTKLRKQLDAKYRSLRKVDADITALETQLNKACDMLEQEVYTVEVFRQRQKTLKENMARLQDSRCKLLDEINRFQTACKERELFPPKIKNLLEAYRTNTVGENNRILKEILDVVYYEKSEPNHRGRLNNANFSLEIYPKIPK